MYKNKVVSLMKSKEEKLRRSPVRRSTDTSEDTICFDEERLKYLLQEDALIKKEANLLMNSMSDIENQVDYIDMCVNAVHTSLSQMEALTRPDFEQRILCLNKRIELLEMGLSAVKEEMSSLWEKLAKVKEAVKLAYMEFNDLDYRSKAIYEELIAMKKSIQPKKSSQ